MGSETEKTGIKIIKAIQTMAAMYVLRLPNRSCAQALIIRPTSWPTTEQFDRPDCHDAVM